MKKSLWLFTLLLATAATKAQTPALQAENSFGGRDIDHGFSIQQTKDGGYIFCGNTASNKADVHGNHGDEDMWVVKLNKQGSIQWQRCLGGTADENAFSIQQTS